MVTAADVEAAGRDGRPLLIVDIAVPRSVERGGHRPPGRHACSISTTSATGPIAGSPCGPPRPTASARSSSEEVDRFALEVTARQSAPLVAQLHDQAENVRAGELARFAGRLADLDEAERDAVDALTRAIVAKLLHTPSVRLRHGAGTPQGERNAAAVSDLFDLG